RLHRADAARPGARDARLPRARADPRRAGDDRQRRLRARLRRLRVHEGRGAVRREVGVRGRARPPRGHACRAGAGPPAALRCDPEGAREGHGRPAGERRRVRRTLAERRRVVTLVLVVKEGPEAGRRLEFDGELVVGREAEGLTIDDSELSRRHAAFRRRGEMVEVEDLGSLNGTFVNGKRIEGVTRLAGGDTIKIGRTVIEAEGTRAAAPTVAAPTPVAVPTAAAAPAVAFGTLAAPAVKGRRGGIASRQLVPFLVSWAVVGGTAVALAIYFGWHH